MNLKTTCFQILWTTWLFNEFSTAFTTWQFVFFRKLTTSWSRGWPSTSSCTWLWASSCAARTCKKTKRSETRDTEWGANTATIRWANKGHVTKSASKKAVKIKPRDRNYCADHVFISPYKDFMIDYMNPDENVEVRMLRLMWKPRVWKAFKTKTTWPRQFVLILVLIKCCFLLSRITWRPRITNKTLLAAASAPSSWFSTFWSPVSSRPLSCSWFSTRPLSPSWSKLASSHGSEFE